MARVELLEENEHPELAESISRIKGARGGRLINIYRLMLHSPMLANAWFDLNQAVRYGTDIDGQSRELAVIRVAILNDVEYVQRAHGPAYALKEGLTADQVTAIWYVVDGDISATLPLSDPSAASRTSSFWVAVWLSWS